MVSLRQKGLPRLPFGETGLSQLILILLLAIGITVGVYLVSQSQTLKPQAASNPVITLSDPIVTCSTTENNAEKFSIEWSPIANAGSYVVSLYQKGDNIRKTLLEPKEGEVVSYKFTNGGVCLPSTATRYNFENKSWPLGVKYEITVTAYSSSNCLYNVMAAAGKDVVNQTSCALTQAPDCDQIATLNPINTKFGLYTQKNCTPTPKCVNEKAVYECIADSPNQNCVDKIRFAADNYKCAPFDGNYRDD